MQAITKAAKAQVSAVRAEGSVVVREAQSTSESTVIGSFVVLFLRYHLCPMF